MLRSMNSVRRRKDGSIDTDYYVAIGNRERGRAIRGLWTRLFRRSKDPRGAGTRNLRGGAIAGS